MDAVWLIIILTAVVTLLFFIIYRWSKPRCVSAAITVLIAGACAVLIYYYILQYGLTMGSATAVAIAAVLMVLIWVFLRKALVYREIVKYQRIELLDQKSHMMRLEEGNNGGQEDNHYEHANSGTNQDGH